MIDLEKGAEYKLNKLAREQMKTKLLADIKFDLSVCDIESWDKKEYLLEIKTLIDSIVNKIK